MKTKNVSTLAALALVSIVSACGPAEPTSAARSTSPGTLNNSQCGFGSTYNGYSCVPGGTPGANNAEYSMQPARSIAPVSSYYGQAGSYSATVSSTTQSRFKLNGQTIYGNQVCVIPAIANGNQVTPLKNGNSPVSQCLAIPSNAGAYTGYYDPTGMYSQQQSGLVFDFPGQQFNAIVVVEQQFLQQMTTFVAGQGYAPPYSYGVIR